MSEVCMPTYSAKLKAGQQTRFAFWLPTPVTFPTPIRTARADLTGCRNTVKLGVAMKDYRHASDRCTRNKLRPPGDLPAWQRENHCRFWQAVSLGRSSEEAAADANVSAPLKPRWFRKAGGMPPIYLAPSKKPRSGRYLSSTEREEIAIGLASASSPHPPMASPRISRWFVRPLFRQVYGRGKLNLLQARLIGAP